jgi:hypothetical protein
MGTQIVIRYGNGAQNAGQYTIEIYKTETTPDGYSWAFRVKDDVLEYLDWFCGWKPLAYGDSFGPENITRADIEEALRLVAPRGEGSVRLADIRQRIGQDEY